MTTTVGRLDSLRCLVLVALDELDDLTDPDPAAVYANRAVRRTAETLRRDWLPHLHRAGEFTLAANQADMNGPSSSLKLKPPEPSVK